MIINAHATCISCKMYEVDGPCLQESVPLSPVQLLFLPGKHVSAWDVMCS